MKRLECPMMASSPWAMYRRPSRCANPKIPLPTCKRDMIFFRAPISLRRGYLRYGGGRFERRDNGVRGSDRGGGRVGGSGRGDRMIGDSRGPPPPPRENRGHGPPQQQQGGGGYGRKNPLQPQQHHNPNYPPKPKGGPPTPQELERANTPIPPEQRRTLVLANIPGQMKFFHIQQHFQNNWNSFVQYSLLDSC